MGDLLNHLDFWLMVFTGGAVLYFLVWEDHVRPVVQKLLSRPDGMPGETRRSRLPRMRPRPLRGHRGQFAGSAAAVPTVPESGNDAERRSADRSASGGVVPGDNDVPIVPVSVPEIVQITMLLVQGMAPSDVAKRLPGYSARNYQGYVARVRQVKVELEAVTAAAEPPAA